ncbi:MAG: B12-binding domain-containing radical SAM protein [Spirochaetota bacterium]
MKHGRPRALLIVPPIYDFALYDLHIAPFGLVRIGRQLSRAGYEVHLVDALAIDDTRSRKRLRSPRRYRDGTGKLFRRQVEWPLGPPPLERSFARYGIVEESLKERVEAAFGRHEPDIVLVTSGMTYWYPGVVEAVRIVRETYSDPPVCVGGIYATLLPQHCAEQTGADEVFAGDAVSVLPTFLSGIGLPPPSRGPVTNVVASGRGSAAVRLNDGCPYRCDYCASHRLAPRFTSGNAVAAFAEVEEAFEGMGVRNFAFYDDALLVNKGAVLHEFLERVISRWPQEPAPHFYLPNAVHMRHLDGETARLMYRARVEEIRLGYESDSLEFHESHDAGRIGTILGDGGPLPRPEPTRPKRARTDQPSSDDNVRRGSVATGSKAQGVDPPEIVDTLRGAGFGPTQIGVYTLAGLPRQSREEVHRTVLAAGELGVNVFVSEFSPVPGSALWDRCVEAGSFPISEEPLYQNNTLLPMAWEGFTHADLAQVKETAAEYRRQLRATTARLDA